MTDDDIAYIVLAICAVALLFWFVKGRHEPEEEDDPHDPRF